MPFTFNIAYGIIGGIGSYIVINGFIYILDKASGGRIKPDESLREPYHPAQNLLSPWVKSYYYKLRRINPPKQDEVEEDVVIDDHAEKTVEELQIQINKDD